MCLGFDELRTIVFRMEDFGILAPAMTKEVAQLVKEARHFLINEYPFNLKWTSEFAQNSIVFGLNEKSGSNYREVIGKFLQKNYF